ncbi:MAG: DUF1016 domain-containing protein [Methanobrevibacter sp.]|jgi:hypothetical protein|nr:DUF1016 domain-containing protein [Candidatus Methanoflexus mossambicus]
MISDIKIPQKLKEVYPNSNNYFKDDYVFEFLDLNKSHTENELQSID